MAGTTRKYVVTVPRLGKKWHLVYITKNKGFTLQKNQPGLRSRLTSNQVTYARNWARKRGFRIRVGQVDQNPFHIIEKKFSLNRSSGDHEAVGVHSKNSYHYRPAPWGGVEAYDYGDASNTRSTLVKAGEHARSHKEQWAEVFGPFPWYIKNGVVYQGYFPNHGDHLHLARSKPVA